MKSKRVFLLTAFLLTHACLSHARSKYISPIDFGLLNAQNGIERYEVLMRCHTYALQNNCNVTYTGIDSLYLEIPSRTEGIPLTDKTDFCGITITVKNQVRDTYLFTMVRQLQPISLTAQQIDNGDMSDNDTLSKGLYLVVIEDKNPWVEERSGYGYPHIRQDVILVENGRAKNNVVMPYCNNYSSPSCTYREVTKNEKLLCNLRFIRSFDSTNKTCLLKVSGIHNLRIKNVYVSTPHDSVLYGDGVIAVDHSTCVRFENITVDGTYSQQDKFGYAFNLNNIWSYTARNITANGNWGVYGTNNMNKVLLKNCVINRFDIHCYGRNVTLKDCRIIGKYNSFGSTFGNVLFEHCIFEESIPYLNAGSYNTFVKVDVVFKKCEFYLSNNINYLVQMMGMRTEINKRQELSEKHLPDITIKDCEVFIPEELSDWFILKLGNYKSDMIVEGGNKILVNHLNIHGNMKTIAHLQSEKINLKKPVNVSIKKVYNDKQISNIKND